MERTIVQTAAFALVSAALVLDGDTVLRSMVAATGGLYWLVGRWM